MNNILISQIYSDKTAMCQIFNLITNSDFKIKDLDFTLKEHKTGSFIVVSPLMSKSIEINSIIHIELDPFSQVRVRELVNGTHYVNHFSKKLSGFLMSKGWISENLRCNRINKLMIDKAIIEEKLNRLIYFH
jgi:hypothetical protein